MLPETIVSDRGAQFVSGFWTAMIHQLGIWLRRSTAFHPYTDGQTEHTNQHVEGFIGNYPAGTGKKWKDWLPIAEYAYNNSKHSATGLSPFYCNYSFHPWGDWPRNQAIEE